MIYNRLLIEYGLESCLRFVNDGAIYYNNEGKLPNLSNGVYKEYVHPTPGLTRGAGPMRVITGGSKMWFTPDHYGTMIQIKF